MQTQRYTEGTHHRPTSELLWSLSTQAIFHSFSPQLSRVTGWSDTDWLGKPLQSFIHPQDLPAIKARYGEVLAGATVWFESVRCVTKVAHTIAWTLCFVPQMENGLASAVLVLGHLATPEADSTVEQAAHPLSALGLFSESEKHPSPSIVEYAGLAKLLEGMLGNAPVGFALLDAELRFICLNQTFSEMTAFSPSQQLGQLLRDVLPFVAVLMEPVMQNVLATGESVIDYEVEIPGAMPLESPGYAQMSFYPIPDQHGGNCGVATIAVDITERKRSEARLKKISDELLRSNQALEQFSYIASHDLKEPLRTISSFVRILKDKYQGKLGQEADQYIAFVMDGTKRMQKLIEKLLEYSRAGKAEKEFSGIDCNTVLQTILHNLKLALEESGSVVTYDPLPMVKGDELLLNQVFQNLVANAIKYRGVAPPRVHVSAKRELGTWVFSVADNGIGISPDQFLNIFAPFRKLHSPAEYAGSGLGLAICQKNIERQGGRIWVASEEGKGSTFSFTLPAVQTGGSSGHETHN